MSPMPEPTSHHRVLASLVGEWIGEQTLHPSPWSPESGTAIGRFSMRMAIDGMFLISDYDEERDGAIAFRGHGVYGWDSKRERYTMHWFDSMGGSPPETLGRFDGESLVFTNRSEQGHARYVYTLRDADHFGFRIEVSADGEQWRTLMHGEFNRP